MLRGLILVCIAASVTAECPNACSGHGTCSNYDQCTCYRNWEAADCSERTCPFDLAHVDTPHGDLDGSADALTTTSIISSSTKYPQGVTEKFPAQTAADEGHFYMECSNKGLCDRKTGECECFDGYEGTACQRASCPNQCSGHGTCETIEELAEDRTFDDHNVFGSSYGGGYGNFKSDMHTYGAYPGPIDAETNPLNYPGSTGVGGSGTSRVKAYNQERGNVPYKLWDKRATMGCACDPGYFAPDCSLRKCKFGVDPLFLAKGTPSYERAVVALFIQKNDALVQFQAKFDLTLFDVFGEDYVIPEVTVSAVSVNNAVSTITGTDCSDIEMYFPNDMLSDTSSTQPFCSRRSMDSTSANAEGTDMGAWSGVTGTGGFAARMGFVFDYGQGNPGFIKDLIVTHPSGAGQTTAAATTNVDTVTFLKTITSQGEWGEFVTTSSYSFVLPAFVKSATASSNVVTTPQKVDQWLAATATAYKSNSIKVYTGAANTASQDTLTLTAVACAQELLPYHTHSLAWGGVGGETAAYDGATFTTATPAAMMHDLCTLTAASGVTTDIDEYDTDRDDTTNGMTITTQLAPNYEYVSQCSNRGTCDSETGLCKCFSGYTNDNCDTQTAII